MCNGDVRYEVSFILAAPDFIIIVSYLSWSFCFRHAVRAAVVAWLAYSPNSEFHIAGRYYFCLETRKNRRISFFHLWIVLAGIYSFGGLVYCRPQSNNWLSFLGGKISDLRIIRANMSDAILSLI